MFSAEGWLKGVNSTGLFRNGGNDDMGKDATPTASPVPGYADNSLVAADAFGFALHYNHKDYRPAGGSILKFFIQIDLQQQPIFEQDTFYYRALFNGNIAGTTTNIPSLTAPNKTGRNYTEYTRLYSYDQLNRLTIAESFPQAFRNTNTLRFWADNSSTEKFEYDKNGNIVDVTRFGMRPSGGIGKMDVLRYFYTAGTNRLNRVRDTWSSTGDFDTDLENQPVDNYGYNAIGNLIRDSSDSITHIAWTVYGKIDSIYKSNGTIISYRYDAGGNRILKSVNGAETIYVRDASGNVMSTYTNDGAGLWQREVHLYGSSRLGLYQVAVNLSNPAPENIITVGDITGKARTFERGNKFFELSNHLGNVLVTVSDRRRSTANTGNPALVSRYQAVVLSAQDYFSFGMIMPGRSFQSTAYRYGFNGKENDNEVKGSGNQQDYGMRIYDPRVGRFLSVDPLTKEYPWLSTYQFAANSPISGIDLDGAEYRYYMVELYQTNGKTNQVVITASRVEYEKEVTIETLFGPKKVKVPRINETFVANVGFYNYKFASYSDMFKAVSVLKDPKIERLGRACHCLPGVGLEYTEEAEEEIGRFFQGLGNSAAAGVAVGDGLKNISGLRLPQGIGFSLFKEVSKKIKSATGGISDDIVVQGSRASGTASSTSDLDIAIKVDAEKFKNLIQKAFKNPKEGTANWRTMQHAIETGKIQSGEAGLRSLRRELEDLIGMEVDVSVILKGGKFDNGVQIPIK